MAPRYKRSLGFDIGEQIAVANLGFAVGVIVALVQSGAVADIVRFLPAPIFLAKPMGLDEVAVQVGMCLPFGEAGNSPLRN